MENATKFLEALVYKIRNPDLRVESFVKLGQFDRSRAAQYFSAAWELAERKNLSRDWVIDEAKKVGLKTFTRGKRMPKSKKRKRRSRDKKSEYVMIWGKALRALGRKNVIGILRALGKTPRAFDISTHEWFWFLWKTNPSYRTEVLNALKKWPEDRINILDDFVECHARAARWRESLKYLDSMDNHDHEIWSLACTLMDVLPKKLADRRIVENFVRRRYGVKRFLNGS